MWLRRLLVSLYGAVELAANTPDEVSWDDLPPTCVVQLHWRPTEPFCALLERHSFMPVVLSRHPLAVLVSILHFAQRESATALWLDGEAGTECDLLDADPASAAFLRYATSARAHVLLGLTPSWCEAPVPAIRMSYERLVDDPPRELERVTRRLGAPTCGSIAEALEANRFESLRDAVSNEHFWRGSPDLWRTLVPASAAAEIAAAHAKLFDELGYEVEPDAELDEATARTRWRSVAGPLEHVDS